MTIRAKEAWTEAQLGLIFLHMRAKVNRNPAAEKRSEWLLS